MRLRSAPCWRHRSPGEALVAAIDPRAVVDPAASLGEGVTVGPFCVVGPHVTLEPGVVLHSNVVVEGRTTVGARTAVFPFASIGHRPQDLKFGGEESTVKVGKDCFIREGVTINCGTREGGLRTVVGDRCTLMAQSHVGHDCHVGDDVVLSNNVMLAGHVTIGNRATLGGGVGVHQFVRVGEMAFVGGLSGLEGDLVPFGMAMGNRARVVGLNLVGLRRHGAPSASIAALSEVLSVLFASDLTLSDRVRLMASRFGEDAYANQLVAFVRDRGRRPLCRPDETFQKGREQS